MVMSSLDDENEIEPKKKRLSPKERIAKRKEEQEVEY